MQRIRASIDAGYSASSQVLTLRDESWRSESHEQEVGWTVSSVGANDEAGTDAWIGNEVVGCEFEDVRHGKRLRQLLGQLSSKMGAATPWACQDWANTKAAYRFFGNERINEANILAGHFSSTRDRFAAADGFPILILHDTTEFSFRHEDTASIGIVNKIPTSIGKPGPPRFHTHCGLLMHSSLVITRDGLRLGLAAIKFWNRDKFHSANALKRRINPTRVPIEKKESIRWLENLRQSTELLGDPKRCVHIGDRESDIFEWFCLAQQLGTHFLVRTCVDRLAGAGATTVAADMKDSELRGLHSLPYDATGLHMTPGTGGRLGNRGCDSHVCRPAAAAD